MGIVKYNRVTDQPFYEFTPRPESFEITTIRGELIFSRLIFKRYPDDSFGFLRSRVC